MVQETEEMSNSQMLKRAWHLVNGAMDRVSDGETLSILLEARQTIDKVYQRVE